MYRRKSGPVDAMALPLLYVCMQKEENGWENADQWKPNRILYEKRHPVYTFVAGCTEPRPKIEEKQGQVNSRSTWDVYRGAQRRWIQFHSYYRVSLVPVQSPARDEKKKKIQKLTTRPVSSPV